MKIVHLKHKTKDVIVTVPFEQLEKAETYIDDHGGSEEWILTVIEEGVRMRRAGYEGVVKSMHTGELEGMCDFRLESGLVTVPVTDLQPLQQTT